MMNDILKQIKAGEVSGVQFKERILDKYDIACELVAFSNSHGGKLVVGIKDKTGETNALSYSEVQETTNLLSDIASENVVPSILIKIDTVEVEKKSNQVKDHNTGLRHSDTDHDTFVEDHDTKRVPLTNKQKDIVNFCSVPRTSREILERAGVVYHTKNIAKYITSLVAAGYLQMTNPDNPTASNQKYKKVNKR